MSGTHRAEHWVCVMLSVEAHRRDADMGCGAPRYRVGSFFFEICIDKLDQGTPDGLRACRVVAGADKGCATARRVLAHRDRVSSAPAYCHLSRDAFASRCPVLTSAPSLPGA
eukprot:3532675-Rhodomonas_salina.6